MGGEGKLNGGQSASGVVALMSHLARDVVAEAGLSWSQVVHAVIGTPGAFDEQSKRVLFASNLPEWGRHGMVTELQVAFGLSLAVENDANLAALGERSLVDTLCPDLPCAVGKAQWCYSSSAVAAW